MGELSSALNRGHCEFHMCVLRRPDENQAPSTTDLVADVSRELVARGASAEANFLDFRLTDYAADPSREAQIPTYRHLADASASSRLSLQENR